MHDHQNCHALAVRAVMADIDKARRRIKRLHASISIDMFMIGCNFMNIFDHLVRHDKLGALPSLTAIPVIALMAWRSRGEILEEEKLIDSRSLYMGIAGSGIQCVEELQEVVKLTAGAKSLASN